jgi:hypothetical protein
MVQIEWGSLILFSKRDEKWDNPSQLPPKAAQVGYKNVQLDDSFRPTWIPGHVNINRLNST